MQGELSTDGLTASLRQLETQPEIRALVDESLKLMATGQWDRCETTLHALLEKGWDPALIYQGLGTCKMNQCQIEASIDFYNRAIALNPTIVTCHDNRILQTDILARTTPAEAQAVRAAWWAQHGAARYATRQPHRNIVDPDRDLRIGYVSGDFRFHSAALGFGAMIFQHDRAYQPIAYSTIPPPHYDKISQQFLAKLGPNFVDVSRYAPSTLAQMIREDQIDILVDLSGYTALNRLQTFAEHPAPIQVTAWGYATGVGWPAMDVLFADPIVLPVADRASMVEHVVDLPCVISLTPREGMGPVVSLPCLEYPPVFGVFQRAMKINAETCRVWSAILRRVPEAALLFKCSGMDATWIAWVHATMDEDVRSRIRFEAPSAQRDHLLWYNAVDLSLDPWPQTGGISTLESIWMGVPVMTLIGPRVIQRTTASVNHVLKLPDFTAEIEAAYIDGAVAWVTTRRQDLAKIRRGLRQRLERSPICRGYVRAVERQYRALWQSWCAQQTATRAA